MKKSIITLLLLAVMSVGVLAVIDAVSLRGNEANAYIRYGDFQSQGTVKEGNIVYSWNTRSGAEVISDTVTQIKFTSDGYAQVNRQRTSTVVTVIYNKNTGSLSVDVPALPTISKSMVKVN